MRKAVAFRFIDSLQTGLPQAVGVSETPIPQNAQSVPSTSAPTSCIGILQDV